MSEQYHIPVLYKETLDALQIQPDGIYVDCTFGGGGHSRGILEQLNENGRLIAFDQDPDAKQNIPDDNRILFVPHNFRHIQRFLRLHKIAAVNGILADLGVSSHQFDVGDRGFSIRFDGPLDMRMDQQQPETAEHLLQSNTEQELQNMFSQYGEVTNAKTLARHIVQQRKQATFKTINEFKALLAPVIKGNPNKYLAQVFQALRIAVNDEMGALKDMLQQLPNLLQPGARVAVITFHSIEDRLVKNFFRQGSFEEIEDNNPFVQHEKFKDLKVITKKPVVPTDAEAKQNPRSRSAKLRVAEKA
ncbi:16S rRNA (cytosine(1402)-N(4))-methyltransferase RsmH [Limnovirga soli]|uniref:Ribosomal RNA small subunit methyltransferase H n=1 Tax=Limnovirga soli TaxID=2656915 RepID=A0A8J8JY66_9BACT|nr:16S rRNA (cytosine(1402)-N(4))-methyltransferase RsmH [Limnovirga soli]NNV57036.1 16S rRNA (cytosine(1402)-N(4))-methyltransferase RsmH [Limnovirga soli]